MLSEECLADGGPSSEALESMGEYDAVASGACFAVQLIHLID